MQSIRFAQLIFFFFLFINTITLSIMLYSNQLVGDAKGVNITIDPIFVLVAFLASVLGFWFLQNSIRLSSPKKVMQIDSANLMVWVEILIVISLALKIAGFLFFGYGVAESRSDIAFGFVFRLIPTYVLFVILFIVPQKLERRYFTYIAIHILTMLAMGWTGGLFDIFWLCIFRLLRVNMKASSIWWLGAFIVVAFMFAPFIYAIKFYIRWGENFSFDYIDILGHLFSRLSYFPPLIFSIQDTGQFVTMAGNYLLPGFTVFDSITSVLPRSLLGIDLENLETVFVKNTTGEFNDGVIFYLGLPAKLFMAAQMSLVDGTATLLMMIVIVAVLHVLLKLIMGPYALVAWSLLLFKWYLSGSFEEPTYYIYGFLVMLLVSRIRLVKRGLDTRGIPCT